MKRAWIAGLVVAVAAAAAIAFFVLGPEDPGSVAPAPAAPGSAGPASPPAPAPGPSKAPEAAPRPADPGEPAAAAGGEALLDALGSADAGEAEGAVEALRRIPWARRFEILRRGLFHDNPRTAVACAWVLDADLLDGRELDRLVQVLIPRVRTMNLEPVRGAETLVDPPPLPEDGEGEPEEMPNLAVFPDNFRLALHRDGMSDLLRNFPGPPLDPKDDSVDGLLCNLLHRSLFEDSCTLAAELVLRGDPRLAREAFLVLMGFTAPKDAGRVAETVWRLNPCVSRADPPSTWGLAQDSEPLPAPKAGMPALFAALAQRHLFCEACRKAAAQRDLALERKPGPEEGLEAVQRARLYDLMLGFLGRWARFLAPSEEDVPLLRSLADPSMGFLGIWGARMLGGFKDPDSVPVLKALAGPGREGLLRAVALSSLARRGDAEARATLADLAGAGDSDALLLLGEIDRPARERALGPWAASVEEPPELILRARAYAATLSLNTPEEALQAAGAALLESGAGAAEILAFHALLPLGARKGAAARMLESLRADPSPIADYSAAPRTLGLLEAWAPAALEDLLRSVAEAGIADVSPAARAAHERMRAQNPPPVLYGTVRSSEEWRALMEQRHRGQYWDALLSLAISGDEAAVREYSREIPKLRYGIWNEDDGAFLGTRLEFVPCLLEAAGANCCMRVPANGGWEKLFGFNDDDLLSGVPEVDGVISPRERLESWWTLMKDRLVLARIPWNWVPKGEE